MKIEGKHRSVLLGLIAKHAPNPRLGVEVGVHRGKTSETLLHAFRGLTLVMVDSWPDASHKTTAWESVRKYFFRCRLVQSDSCGAIAMASVPDGAADFVFIDADHSYEGVKRDLAAWYPKVKPGGLFSGHDYGKTELPGVKQAVDEWAAQIGVEINVDFLGNIWWILKP